jgi:transcriptional regulator with XRE-family HTH domain
MNSQRCISEIREGAGFTQKELAEMLCISDKSLWNYENDSSNIPNSVLSKIMFLFGLTYDQIFLGKKYDYIVFKKNQVLEKAKILSTA